MHYVYILQSLKDNGFYIGCTSDLKERLYIHNSGKTLSLKNRRPLKVVYSEKYENPVDAYKREKQIKSYKGGEAFKILID
jgi:putative endonuclease